MTEKISGETIAVLKARISVVLKALTKTGEISTCRQCSIV